MAQTPPASTWVPVVAVAGQSPVPEEATHHLNTMSMSVSKRISYVSALKNAEVAAAAAVATKAAIASSALKQLDLAESKLCSAQDALCNSQSLSQGATEHIRKCQKELDDATEVLASVDVGAEDVPNVVPVSPLAPVVHVAAVVATTRGLVTPAPLASIRGPIATAVAGPSPVMSAASVKVAREVAGAKARIADLQSALIAANAAYTQSNSRETAAQRQVETAIKARDVSASASQVASAAKEYAEQVYTQANAKLVDAETALDQIANKMAGLNSSLDGVKTE